MQSPPRMVHKVVLAYHEVKEIKVNVKNGGHSLNVCEIK